MASIFEELCRISFRDLCLMVMNLRRENSCLKSDLIRFQMLSEKYENYFNELRSIKQISFNFDHKFIKQINALKETKSCFIQMSSTSKGVNKSEDNVNDGHKSDPEEEVETTESPDNECDIISQSNDKSVPENEDTNDSQVIEGNKVIIDLEMSESDENMNETEDLDENEDTNGSQVMENLNDTNETNDVTKDLIVIESDSSDESVIDETEDHVNVSQQSEDNHQNPDPMTAPDRPFACDVEGCEKSLKTLLFLRQHKYHKHGLKYRCEHMGCAYAGSVESDLTEHRLTAHSKKRRFKCPMDGCDKWCDKGHIKIHQLAAHPMAFPEVPWIRCSHTGCTFKSKSKTYIGVHRKYHKNPKNRTKPEKPPKKHRPVGLPDGRIRCSLNGCKKRLKSEFCLRQHQLGVHPKQFPDIPWIHCTHTGCPFKSKLKSTSNNHIKSSHKRLTI